MLSSSPTRRAFGPAQGDRLGSRRGAALRGLALGEDLVGELVGVAGLDVPLPLGAVGVGHPGLDLAGVAADRVVDPGGLEPGLGQAGLGGGDLGGGLGLDAEVVDRAAFGALEEDELQGRVGDLEVGVAGLALGRLGREQLRVEVDGLVDVGDVECELDTGHGILRLDRSTIVDVHHPSNASTEVNTCRLSS